MDRPDQPPGIAIRLNLLCQISLGILAMAACLPSMPYWMEHFGESQARVQLTFAAYLLAFAFAQLIYGPLSDNYGRRPVLVVGLTLGLAGSIAAIFAQSLDALILARGVQGAGMGCGMVIGRAMIQDSFGGAARTKMMAYVGMVMGLCPPGGTLLGGRLHVMFGWQASFVAVSLITLVLLLAAWFGLPDQRRRDARSLGAMIRSYRILVADYSYLSFCFIAAFSSSAFYVFLAAAPIVLDAYDVPPDRIGWYILFVPAAYILGNLLTTRVAGRLTDQRLMLSGQLLNLVGIGTVLTLALAGLHHPIAIAAPLALMGFGHGLLMPPTLGGAVGAVPALAGAAAAMAGMLQQLTGAAASSLTGFIDLTTGTAMAALMLTLTLLAIAAQAAPALIRRRAGLRGSPSAASGLAAPRQPRR